MRTKERLPPVPLELRVQIGELLDKGKEPPVIASELGIREIQVHQVTANREHIQAKRSFRAHRAAAAKLTGQIKRLGTADAGQGKWDLQRQPDHPQAQPVAPRSNGAGKFPRHTLLKNASGKCLECQQFINENLHVVEASENTQANLYHETCCPECGSVTEKGEN